MDVLGSTFCFVRVTQAVVSPLFIFWIPELASQGPGTHVSDVQERFFYFLNFSLEAI
jgi:hypothetical protein